MQRALVISLILGLIVVLFVSSVSCDKKNNNNNQPVPVASVEIMFPTSHAYSQSGGQHHLKVPKGTNNVDLPSNYRVHVIARDSQGNSLSLSGRTIVWTVPGMGFFQTDLNPFDNTYLQFQATGDWFDNSNQIPQQTVLVEVSVDGVSTSFTVTLYGIINVSYDLWHHFINGGNRIVAGMFQVGDRLTHVGGLGTFIPDSTPPPMITGNQIYFQSSAVAYSGTFTSTNNIVGSHDGLGAGTWTANRP